MTAVTASSGSRVPLRAIAAVMMLTLCLLVLAARPARADCDVLDPTCVGETVDDTTDEVVETVDEVVETVDDTVEEVVGTVEEAADEVVETVEETVAAVTDTVDETIDPIAPIPGVPDVPETPGVDDPPTGEDPNPGVDSSVVRPDPRGGSGPLAGAGPLAGSGPLGPAGFVGDAILTSPQGLLGPFAGPAADLAKRLAFPLALIVLVFAFVAVQNRLDRKDPKLALAATAPDVLSFA